MGSFFIGSIFFINDEGNIDYALTDFSDSLYLVAYKLNELRKEHPNFIDFHIDDFPDILMENHFVESMDIDAVPAQSYIVLTQPCYIDDDENEYFLTSPNSQAIKTQKNFYSIFHDKAFKVNAHMHPNCYHEENDAVLFDTKVEPVIFSYRGAPTDLIKTFHTYEHIHHCSVILEKEHRKTILEFMNSADFDLFAPLIDEIESLKSGFIEGVEPPFVDDRGISEDSFIIDTDGTTIESLFGQQWKNNFDFLAELEKHDDLFVTVQGHQQEQITFDCDNIIYIRDYLADVLTVYHQEQALNQAIFSVGIRQITNIWKQSDQPEKRVAYCIMTGDGIYSINKEQALIAATTDPQTGERLEKEPAVNYIDFEQMLKILGTEVETLAF